MILNIVKKQWLYSVIVDNILMNLAELPMP